MLSHRKHNHESINRIVKFAAGKNKKDCQRFRFLKCSAWSNGEQWWNSSAHSPEHLDRRGSVDVTGRLQLQ